MTPLTSTTVADPRSDGMGICDAPEAEVGSCLSADVSDTSTEMDTSVGDTVGMETAFAPAAALEPGSTPAVLSAWIGSPDGVAVTLGTTTWLALGETSPSATVVFWRTNSRRGFGKSSTELTMIASLSESGSALSAYATRAIATHSTTTRPVMNGHLSGEGL